MNASSFLQQYMKSRDLTEPAFNYEPGKGFVPTSNTQKIVDLFRKKSGKNINIEPANSVMAIEGSPIWGGGGGVVFHDNPSMGIVDPLKGTAHVVAHEAGHAAFPSLIQQQNLAGKLQNQFDPLSIPRETGQRMRYVHETFAKPTMAEEASAQGLAYGALNALGIPVKEEWSTPTAYPASFLDQGIGKYMNTEIGPPTPAERKELQTILRSTDPFLQRVFKQNYNMFN
jgi:hypothetical protein